MPRRVRQSKPLLPAMAGGLMKRLGTNNSQFKKKLLKYGYWAIGLFLAYSALSPTFGLSRIVRLELEKSTLLDANRQEIVKLIDAERIKQLLKDDRNYIEYIARTRFHMIYPHETVYRYYGQ